jgi:hypothetical protein
MDIFRGLKFSPNAEIGENSHSWMDTNYRAMGLAACANSNPNCSA